MTRYVAYLRVSTQRQGAFGLGIEAQREAVTRHAATGGIIVAEVVETESGKRADRPELARAMALCRVHKATLLIAKIDRLARDAYFLLGLKTAGIEFLAADMPNANRLTVGIMAMVAEEKARMISVRTKAALAAAKTRGVKLGNPNLRPGNPEQARAAAAVKVAKATAKATDLRPVIIEIQAAGVATLDGLAKALTARGVPSPGGGAAWHRSGVHRLLRRLEDAA
jgi:DNA invertase Pin-like site-specific DNA recombinase